MASPPKFENAPGLVLKPRKAGWEARWVARRDIIKRGYMCKSLRLWTGVEPTDIERAFIQQRCNDMQTEMLVWGRGGIPEVGAFDGTVANLIRCYKMDKDSPYRKKRYQTRLFYDALCKRIEKDHGERRIADLKARDILHWHEGFEAEGKVSMGHAVVGMFRTLCGFGLTMLEDDQCERLSVVLSKMRFTMAKPRTERLSAEQAMAVIAEARKQGRKSIALAQAIQFGLMLRQKDVIGEWVPMNEPGVSAVHSGNNKWLRGITWNEINENFILTHITSKRQKEIVVDLKLDPMIVAELGSLNRADFPASGPVIVSEKSGVPWTKTEFSRIWRELATAAGIPKAVRNMDSRAGAISEATDAGADLEHVRHAATHSDIGMTQKYSRNGTEKTDGVMRKRVAHRGTKRDE
jgi:hypothetical protein